MKLTWLSIDQVPGYYRGVPGEVVEVYAVNAMLGIPVPGGRLWWWGSS